MQPIYTFNAPLKLTVILALHWFLPPTFQTSSITLLTTFMKPSIGLLRKRTWITGLNVRPARFPPSCWNQADRVQTDLNRTKNYCESFNKTFSVLLLVTPILQSTTSYLYSKAGSLPTGEKFSLLRETASTLRRMQQ